MGHTRRGSAPLAVLIACLLVAASACTWLTGARSRIYWYPCSDAMPVLVDACGYLRVPLDHNRPNGETTLVAVSRMLHRVPESQYQGVILVNPGGPGMSGILMAALGRLLPPEIRDAYDWIGFDPRGVGSSSPWLSCVGDYQGPGRPDYVPTTPEIEQAWLDRSRDYAEACGSSGGNLLNFMSTADTARDMESIRAVLGVPTISYYGFSYGTYLGQVYATLFPQRVERMVLDSNVDPRSVWYQFNLDQDVAFEHAMEAWFGWIARHDASYHLGTTAEAVEARWRAEQDALRGAPAAGLVGPDEWVDIFLEAAYDQARWPSLAESFAGWVSTRQTTPLVNFYFASESVSDDRVYAVNQAVKCTDAAWPASWDRWKADAWRTHETAPTITWLNVWFNAPCLFWPATPRQPVPVDGSRAPPVLLVGTTGDAATPFAGALEVRRRFPGARLVAEQGGTNHAGSLRGNACIDDAIKAYLATGAVPPRVTGDGPDVSCRPLPEPEPNHAVAEAPAPALADAGTTGD